MKSLLKISVAGRLILVMLLCVPGLLTMGRTSPYSSAAGATASAITAVSPAGPAHMGSATVTGPGKDLPDNSLNGATTITVGTGTVSCNYPYTTYWMGGRTELLYTAADLTAAGATPGIITSIGFEINSYSNQTMTGFNISMGNTTASVITDWNMTTLQNCYSGTYGVPGIGWQMITLQNPFYWDGSNLILHICFGNNGSYTSYSYVSGTTAPTGQIWPYWMDNTVGCIYSGAAYTGYTGLPNLRFVEQAPVYYVGTGTISCNYPYTTYWMGGRTELLYTSAELAAAGITPGNITSIGFNVYSYSDQVMNGFNISLGNTTSSTITDWSSIPLQNCYSGTYQVPGNGWQSVTLQTPFPYDGTNLAINICFHNTSYTSYSYVYGTTAPTEQIRPYWMDNTDGCAYTGPPYIAYTGLPNLRVVEQLVPGPAVLFSPNNNGTGISTATSLNWTPPVSGAGPAGYKLYFGTNNPPTNIVNGADLGNALTYDPNPDMNVNTTYYWKVVPYNNNGNAINVPVWSFTTQLLPTPWESCLVGSSAGTAFFTPASGMFTLSSTGYSSSNSDVQESAYLNLNGNGSIVARVVDLTGGGWAGVQIRESCSPGAKKVLLKTQLQTILKAEVRQTSGGGTISTQIMRGGVKWLKLVRTGNRFDEYTSVDGIAWWSAFSTTLAMNTCVQMGLFSEGLSFSRAYQARFDNVMVTGSLCVAPSKSAEPEPQNVIAATGSRVEIYPNPASKRVNVLISEPAEKVCLDVYSSEGKLVRSMLITEQSSEVDISLLKPGIYILRFNLDGALISKRLVVI